LKLTAWRSKNRWADHGEVLIAKPSPIRDRDLLQGQIRFPGHRVQKPGSVWFAW
jgi:hypothetical protein